MSFRLFKVVWQHAHVTGSAKGMLLALTDYADDDGRRIYPSHRALAKKTGLSVSYVRKLLKRLIDDGYLERVSQGGYYEGRNRASEYRLAPDWLARCGYADAPTSSSDPNDTADANEQAPVSIPVAESAPTIASTVAPIFTPAGEPRATETVVATDPGTEFSSGIGTGAQPASDIDSDPGTGSDPIACATRQTPAHRVAGRDDPASPAAGMGGLSIEIPGVSRVSSIGDPGYAYAGMGGDPMQTPRLSDMEHPGRPHLDRGGDPVEVHGVSTGDERGCPRAGTQTTIRSNPRSNPRSDPEMSDEIPTAAAARVAFRVAEPQPVLEPASEPAPEPVTVYRPVAAAAADADLSSSTEDFEALFGRDTDSRDANQSRGADQSQNALAGQVPGQVPGQDPPSANRETPAATALQEQHRSDSPSGLERADPVAAQEVAEITRLYARCVGRCLNAGDRQRLAHLRTLAPLATIERALGVVETRLATNRRITDAIAYTRRIVMDMASDSRASPALMDADFGSVGNFAAGSRGVKRDEIFPDYVAPYTDYDELDEYGNSAGTLSADAWRKALATPNSSPSWA